jgi:hypothetical protein
MEMPPDTLEAVGVNELFVAVTVDESFTTEQTVVGRIDETHPTPIVGYLSPSQICDTCALLRARNLDMQMPPDSLEDFLTPDKGSKGVCSLVCANVFPSFLDLPIFQGDSFLSKFFFFKNSRPIPGESSMFPTPSLQSSCSAECVFVGLGDRVHYSSFCGFCMLVIC